MCGTTLTGCILMDFPVQLKKTIGMGLCIIHFKVSQVDISQLWCSSVLGDYFILTNSVDPECGISSGSSLFAKDLFWDFSTIQWVKKNGNHVLCRPKRTMLGLT